MYGGNDNTPIEGFLKLIDIYDNVNQYLFMNTEYLPLLKTKLKIIKDSKISFIADKFHKNKTPEDFYNWWNRISNNYENTAKDYIFEENDFTDFIINHISNLINLYKRLFNNDTEVKTDYKCSEAYKDEKLWNGININNIYKEEKEDSKLSDDEKKIYNNYIVTKLYTILCDDLINFYVIQGDKFITIKKYLLEKKKKQEVKNNKNNNSDSKSSFLIDLDNYLQKVELYQQIKSYRNLMKLCLIYFEIWKKYDNDYLKECNNIITAIRSINYDRDKYIYLPLSFVPSEKNFLRYYVAPIYPFVANERWAHAYTNPCWLAYHDLVIHFNYLFDYDTIIKKTELFTNYSQQQYYELIFKIIHNIFDKNHNTILYQILFNIIHEDGFFRRLNDAFTANITDDTHWIIKIEKYYNKLSKIKDDKKMNIISVNTLSYGIKLQEIILIIKNLYRNILEVLKGKNEEKLLNSNNHNNHNNNFTTLIKLNKVN